MEKAGYNRELVTAIVINAKKNGIWNNGKTVCEWADKKNGTLAFWMDCATVLGWVNRVD